jgi:hypothetical protein
MEIEEGKDKIYNIVKYSYVFLCICVSSAVTNGTAIGHVMHVS